MNTHYKNWLIDKDDKHIITLTLDKPETTTNVLSQSVLSELQLILDDIKHSQSRALIFKSAKKNSFIAGADVTEFSKFSNNSDPYGAALGAIQQGQLVMNSIESLAFPSFALINGFCLGGGMELAIACDVIVAAKGAQFGQPEIKVGFFPPYAAMRLPQLVGPARAIEICTTGKFYSAEEAQLMGMVGYVAEDDRLGETTDKIVKEIQTGSALIIRLNKRAVRQHLGLAFKPALAGVSDLFLNTLMKTEDTQEGIASYEEKRKPVWKNR